MNKWMKLIVAMVVMTWTGHAGQFGIRALESDKFEGDTGEVTPFTFVVERGGDVSKAVSVRYWVREIGRGGNGSANSTDLSIESVDSSVKNWVDQPVTEGLSDVKFIEARGDFGYALMKDGTLVRLDGYEWDHLVFYGNQLQGLFSFATDFAVGESHMVVLFHEGNIHAWGDNDSGQVDVPKGIGHDVVDIDAGCLHTVALKADGTVVGWGSDDPGDKQIAGPPWVTGWSQPLPLHDWNEVTAIAAGWYHTVALKTDGTVVAEEHWTRIRHWFSPGTTPVGLIDVPEGLNDVTAIAAGAYHTMALKADGTVVAWGSNDYGQAEVPEGLSDVTAIAAGDYHSIALKADGTMINWGKVGISPIDLSNELDEIKDITGGYASTMILKKDGTLVNWGRGGHSLLPVPEGMDRAVSIDAGVYHAVAVKADGTVIAWGNNYFGQIDVPERLNGVTTIAAGAYHTAALKADGTVVAWGSNDYGQAEVPEGLNDVTGIYAGAHHTVALKADGTVVAWGSEDRDQLPDSTGLSDVAEIVAGCLEATRSPANVPEGLDDVTEIAAGDCHTVALRADGTVVAWGSNDYGQIDVPEGLDDVTEIAAGGGHAVALKADGTIVTWGSNLGAHFEELRDVTGIHAGSYGALARKSDGTIHSTGGWWNGWGGVRIQVNVPEDWNVVTDVAAGERQLMIMESSIGSIDFAPGENSRTLTIGVRGDDVPESDETFTVMLLARQEEDWNGSTSAQGVIRDDDHPMLMLLRPARRNGVFAFSAAYDNGFIPDSIDAQRFVVRSTRDFRTWRMEPEPLVERNGILHWEGGVEPEAESRFFQVVDKDHFVTE